MPVGGDASSDPQGNRARPSWLTGGFRGLRTVLLYVVVCVASFVVVVVVFSMAESMWLGR